MKRKVWIILACCLGILWGVGAAQADIMAHWTFDNSTDIGHDSVGSFNGTPSASGVSYDSSGVSGGAISLNRLEGGLVNMGDVLNLAGTAYTIAVWVNTTTAETDCVMVGKHTATVHQGYILGVNTSAGGGYGGTNKAWFYNDTQPGPTSTTSVNDGGWHQIVVTRAVSGNASLYVDGGREATFAMFVPDNGAPLLFGGYSIAGTPTASYTGSLDDIQFYNTALSAGEISYLYNHPGQAVPVPPAVWLFGPGLLGLAGWEYRRRKR